jgi:hypothetical protein
MDEKNGIEVTGVNESFLAAAMVKDLFGEEMTEEEKLAAEMYDGIHLQMRGLAHSLVVGDAAKKAEDLAEPEGRSHKQNL